MVGGWALLRDERAAVFGRYTYGFGWPFGVLQVRSETLVFDLLKPYGWLFRVGAEDEIEIPIVVPIAEISGIRASWGFFREALLISDHPVFGRLSFSAPRPGFERVIQALEAMGVRVVRGLAG